MTVIQTNLSADRSARLLRAASEDVQRSLLKLTSGNQLADPANPSTEAIMASRHRGSIRRLQVGRENLTNALSFSQTQEGFLEQAAKALSRMGELALRAMDATMGDQQSAIEEKRFELVQGNFTWQQAKTDAESRGGSLATIKSQEEQDEVEALLHGNASYWIGASDAGQEGQWTWVDGDAFTFTHWNAGEPNNSGGNEHYAQIYSDGKWNDLPASSNHANLSGYIIEFTPRATGPSLYESEYSALAAFVESLGSKAFNQVSLFAGQTMQVARDEESHSLQTRGIDLAATTYSSTYTPDGEGYFLRGTAQAHARLLQVKGAIEQLQQDRATVGAFAKGIDLADRMLTHSTDLLKQTLGRLTDVNIAEESTRFARDQILRQTATAMLAQANIMPQSVLRLVDLERS